jgi:hypothetical protein
MTHTYLEGDTLAAEPRYIRDLSGESIGNFPRIED